MKRYKIKAEGLWYYFDIISVPDDEDAYEYFCQNIDIEDLRITDISIEETDPKETRHEAV